MRYYPAFDLPARRALPPPIPAAERLAAQLLIVPRIDRRLTLGDTHVDDRPGSFGSDEDGDQYLLEQARDLLSPDVPPVERRWTGSYLRRTDGLDCALVELSSDGCLLVAGAGGMGMTAAPASLLKHSTWPHCDRRRPPSRLLAPAALLRRRRDVPTRSRGGLATVLAVRGSQLRAREHGRLHPHGTGRRLHPPHPRRGREAPRIPQRVPPSRDEALRSGCRAIGANDRLSLPPVVVRARRLTPRLRRRRHRSRHRWH